MAEDACRLDVWLWRARFCKTRTLAAEIAGKGVVRLTRAGTQERVRKPAKTIRQGDVILFAHAGRVHNLRIEAVGTRRGPPAEAAQLYSVLP